MINKLIDARKEDRRQKNNSYEHDNRRLTIRREYDRKKLEELLEEYKAENERLRAKNAHLIVSKKEEIVWYIAIFLGLSILIGWHTLILIQN